MKMYQSSMQMDHSTLPCKSSNSWHVVNWTTEYVTPWIRGYRFSIPSSTDTVLIAKSFSTVGVYARKHICTHQYPSPVSLCKSQRLGFQISDLKTQMDSRNLYVTQGLKIFHIFNTLYTIASSVISYDIFW